MSFLILVIALLACTCGLAWGMLPDGSIGTIVLIKLAGFPIPIVIMRTLVLRSRLMDTLMIPVEGTRWATYLDALMSVPVLIVWTVWLDASLFFVEKSIGALAFIVQGVIFLAVPTEWDLITFVDVGECSRGTCAGINGWIPYLSIVAVDSWRETWACCPDFAIRTLAWFILFIPHPPIWAGIGDTKMAIPDSSNRALAGPYVLIPYHASITFLYDPTHVVLPDCPSRAHACPWRFVP